MKDKLIIIAAGEGERWGNYTGVPKHLVEIDGESILQRQVRLFEMETVVIGNDERYEVEGAKLIKPEITGKRDVNQECLLTEPFWNKEGRTIITLGDIYFTEEAVKTIKDFEKRELHFFGREGAGVTCAYGELFAHSFYPEHFDEYKNAYHKAKELRDKGEIDRCEWWEHYRISDGQDPRRHTTGERFTNINDFTDDFDLPKDYDEWIKQRNY